MSSVVIAGDTSGSVTISAPAVAGSTTLTLPTTNGTLSTGMVNLGTITLSGTGNQFSLTGLTLTSYKQLYLVYSNVSSGAVATTGANMSIANTTGDQTASNYIQIANTTNTGYVNTCYYIDLTTGLTLFPVLDKNAVPAVLRNTTSQTLPIPLGAVTTTNSTLGGATAIGTASTAIYAYCIGSATKSGTITIYGVA